MSIAASGPAPGATANGQLEHRGVRAVQRMLEYAPSSGALALWMHHRDLGLDDAPDGRLDRTLAPVFTDGRVLYYRPAFEALPLDEQTGWVAHAMLHLALRHVPRFVQLQRRLGDVDLDLYNRCADAIVNAALAPVRWLALPDDAVTLEQVVSQVLGHEHSRDTALLEWDVERLYRAVDDRRAARPGTARQPDRGGAAKASGSNSGRPTAGAAADDTAHAAGRRGAEDGDSPRPSREDGLRAGLLRRLTGLGHADLVPTAGSPDAPEDEADAAREWAERLVRAQAGDGPHSLLRGLLADLPRVRTPWEQVLRVRLARGLSRRPDLSWSRPSRSWLANQGRLGPGRRWPWEPGQTGAHRVPRLVLVVDNSGSIDDGLLERFAREVQAIVRRLEASLVLVVGDSVVRRVVPYEPGRADLRSLQVAGGGGTDFTPLLQEADRHRPDLVVVLTDLDGPARHQPRCPVLWAVPADGPQRVEPFGRQLRLD